MKILDHLRMLQLLDLASRRPLLKKMGDFAWSFDHLATLAGAERRRTREILAELFDLCLVLTDNGRFETDRDRRFYRTSLGVLVAGEVIEIISCGGGLFEVEHEDEIIASNLPLHQAEDVARRRQRWFAQGNHDFRFVTRDGLVQEHLVDARAEVWWTAERPGAMAAE